MTVIAVKDGVLAVDRAVSCNDRHVGQVAKWREVPSFHGGGFVAVAGSLAQGLRALEAFIDTGNLPSDKTEHTIVWLRGDGVVLIADEGLWLSFDAPFVSEGSGAPIAQGAMAAGADAVQAAEIACEFDAACRGPVDVLRLSGDL